MCKSRFKFTSVGNQTIKILCFTNEIQRINRSVIVSIAQAGDRSYIFSVSDRYRPTNPYLQSVGLPSVGILTLLSMGPYMALFHQRQFLRLHEPPSRTAARL